MSLTKRGQFFKSRGARKVWNFGAQFAVQGPRFQGYFGARQQYRGHIEGMVGQKKNVLKIWKYGARHLKLMIRRCKKHKNMGPYNKNRQKTWSKRCSICTTGARKLVDESNFWGQNSDQPQSQILGPEILVGARKILGPNTKFGAKIFSWGRKKKIWGQNFFSMSGT